MMSRNGHAGHMASTLRLWSSQIAEIQALVHEAGTGQRGKLTDTLAALRLQQATYQQQMIRLRTASDELVDGLVQGSDRMAEAFARSYAQVSRRFDA